MIALYGVNGGRCTCGKADCGSPGKHPRTAHGLRDASTDPAVIAARWRQWPDASIGIAMSGPDRLVAVDIDGPAGEASLGELVRQHGVLPATLESRTGTRRHKLFAVPEGANIRPSAGVLGKGLDIRAEGSYIVAPPSLHVTGRRYHWAADCPIACMPDWLTKLLTAPRRPRSEAANGADKIQHPDRHAALVSLAGSLRARAFNADDILAALSSFNRMRCRPPKSGDELSKIARDVGVRRPSRAPGDALDRRMRFDVAWYLDFYSRRAACRTTKVAESGEK